MTRPSVLALVGFLIASGLLTAGAAWFSVGAGMVVAGLCVALVTVLAFNLLGDGLRDALDPRLVTSRESL